jgi:hypothetical protein
MPPRRAGVPYLRTDMHYRPRFWHLMLLLALAAGRSGTRQRGARGVQWPAFVALRNGPAAAALRVATLASHLVRLPGEIFPSCVIGRDARSHVGCRS